MIFFSLVNFYVADEVGVGYFFTFGCGLFGDKKYCVGAFNLFVGETRFSSTLYQAEKIVGGGNLPVQFLRAKTEGVERGLGTGIGVYHCGCGGSNGVRFLVVSVSGRISMWS